MRTLLLDASVWLAAVDADDRFHHDSRELVATSPSRLAALDLTLYEVGNVATVRWHAPERARDLARLIAACCQDRVLAVDAGVIETAAALADEEGITVYDAAYVAQTRARGWTLVSGDVADLVGRGLAVAPPEAG